MKQRFDIEGMTCSACQAAVSKAVSKLGVTEVNVNLINESMTVDYDPSKLNDEKIIKAVVDAGYNARVKGNNESVSKDLLKESEEDNTKFRLKVSFFFMIILMYVAMGPMINLPLPRFLEGTSGAINNALNAIWGSLIGPHIMTIDFKKQENGKVLERKYISEGNFKDTISHNWSDIFGVDIKSDINSLRRVIIQTTDSGGNIIYYRNYGKNNDGPLHTYEIPSGSKAHLLEFLKRFESNYIAHIKLGVDEVKKLLVNYYANYGANADRVESDLKIPKSNNTDTEAIRQAAAHCLDKLKGYALDDSEGKNPGNYKDLTIYSNSHISDRVAFLKEYVLKDIGEKSSSNIYYIDFNNGRVKDAGNDLKINGDEANDEVVFIDGGRTKESFAVSNRKVYGYSKDDTIIYKYGNNYIEAGKGSDTITTGSGNDTIYTNADIDDEFDTEDKNTTNTVNSGAGDDTIYGSKGKDIITTKKAQIISTLKVEMMK